MIIELNQNYRIRVPITHCHVYIIAGYEITDQLAMKGK